MTACAHGQVQNEGDPATAETRRKQNVRPVAHHARWPKLSRRQADDRLLRWQFAIIIAAGDLRPCRGENYEPLFGPVLPDRTRMAWIWLNTSHRERGNGR
jgi:hypothetical protein